MISHRIPAVIGRRLNLPLIAAPMLRVSGPDLVVAACRAGVIGAFPTKNARSVEELDTWLGDIKQRSGAEAAPYCPNLIVRDTRFKKDLDCLVRHRVEVVITSVGSPAAAVSPLHDIGCLVFADIATMHHAERSLEAGVDGLILLTAGAGGQTGWLNPFAFVRAIREMTEKIVVLAGGISDGHALRAAIVLGCDLAYMGTKFIATNESIASEAYRRMLVESGMDDVMLTSAFTGLPANMLRPSIEAADRDPKRLEESVSEERARTTFSGDGAGAKRWRDIWSAGHSVSGVTGIMDVHDLVQRTKREYAEALPLRTS